MLIRDAIDGFFAIIGQPGATHAIGQKYILTLAQMALCHIWGYKGYDRTWQHWKDSFLTTQGDTVKIVTTHPIKRVDKLYEGTMTNRDGVVFNPQSFCEDCPGEGIVCVPCSCECNECIDLGMLYANPQDRLCAGFYQVSGSDYQGMGGLGGQIVRAKLRKQVQSLWITYYRDVPKLKTFDDKFPIPMQFMAPFCYYMAFIALGRYGQFRAGEEVNFYQVANTMMDEMKEKDSNSPKQMVFDHTKPNVNTSFY